MMTKTTHLLYGCKTARMGLFACSNRLTVLVCLGVLAAMPWALYAEPTEATATPVVATPEIVNQLNEAYQQAKTYQSKAQVHIRLQQGNSVLQSQDFSYQVIFDRAKNNLKLVRPDLQLLAKDGKLALQVHEIPQRYLEVAMPGTLNYETLVQKMPFLVMPQLFDLALMTQGSIVPADAKSLPADATGRPGVTYHQGKQTITLRLDPKTHFIRTASLKNDPNKSDQYIAMEYELTPSADAPLANDAFALNVGQAKAVATFQELIGSPAQKDSLEGKAAPDFTLKDSQGKTVALKDLQANHKLVIIDFWATWCGPCRVSLPKIQQVSDWVAQNKHPVAIYTINLRESVDKATEMFKKMNLTLPILMDSEGTVGGQYHIEAIPQTIIIKNGKIEKIHLGSSPTLDADLKSEITRLLAGD